MLKRRNELHLVDSVKKLSLTLRLIHMGYHLNSKVRLGWAGAAETFHSSATTPEASHLLQGCNLTAHFYNLPGGDCENKKILVQIFG